MSLLLAAALTVVWIFVIGAIAFYALSRLENGRRSAIPLAIGAVVIFLLGSLTHPTRMLTEGFRQIAVSNPPPAAESLPGANELLPTSAHLDALRYSGVASTATVDFVGYIAVDATAPVEVTSFHFPASGALYVSGWAADEGKSPAAGVFLLIDGRARYDGFANRYGIARPDVAKALSNARLTNTGYSVELKLEGLPVGAHFAQVALITADRKGFLLIPKRIDFTEAAGDTVP